MFISGISIDQNYKKDSKNNNLNCNSNKEILKQSLRPLSEDNSHHQLINHSNQSYQNTNYPYNTNKNIPYSVFPQLKQSHYNRVFQENNIQNHHNNISNKIKHHAKEKRHRSSNKINLNTQLKSNAQKRAESQSKQSNEQDQDIISNLNNIKIQKSLVSSKNKIKNFRKNQTFNNNNKIYQQQSSHSIKPHHKNLYKSPNRIKQQSNEIDHFKNNKIHNIKNIKNFINTGSNLKLNQVSKDLIEYHKVIVYFRYYPMNLIAACGQKQQLFKLLQQNGDFKSPYMNQLKKNQIVKPSSKQIQNVWFKLLKLAQLKGKYKYRQKFNYAYSAQLKALKYKRKQWKKKKESSSSQSESDGQKRQKCRDMDTWKKSMGVQGKVFIIKGGYKDLKNALIEKGWVQNPDKYSNFFDLKWTTKINDINFDSLKPGQIVNHFDNNACLTSKYGICKSLRSISFSESIDIDGYFPKAYDLSDLTDFQNFLEVYKMNFCQSILKKYITNQKDLLSSSNIQQIEQEENEDQIDITEKKIQKNQNLIQLKVKIAIMVTQRRLSLIKNIQLGLIDILKQRYPLCSINQWNLLISPKNEAPFKKDQIVKTWNRYLQYQKQCSLGSNDLIKQSINLLNNLKKIDPQYDLNGTKNIWIVKPAFLSRGRGIKCMTELTNILDFSMGKETQYVVQKYIQNPLLINKRKFDIRQWVLIQDYNPAKIWFYGQFYVRFCLQQYHSSKIGNKYAHLTNNSIQKTNKNKNKIMSEQNIEQMWTQQQLKEHLDNINERQQNQKQKEKQKLKIQQKEQNNQKQDHAKKSVMTKILSKMKQVVIASILCTQDQVYGRKNTFQLVGYDFMIDDNFNPWLIQINSSPSMDQSNPVTKKLVKSVLQDTAKLISQSKSGSNKAIKNKKIGLFKCIYKGDTHKWKNYKINQD